MITHHSNLLHLAAMLILLVDYPWSRLHSIHPYRSYAKHLDDRDEVCPEQVDDQGLEQLLCYLTEQLHLLVQYFIWLTDIGPLDNSYKRNTFSETLSQIFAHSKWIGMEKMSCTISPAIISRLHSIYFCSVQSPENCCY